MRWSLVLLLIPILLATSANAVTEALYVMDEDSTFQSDRTINEILGLKNDTIVLLSSNCEDVTVELIDGYLNITATNNFNGGCWVGFGYSQDGIATDGAFLVNVTPINDDPKIINIILSGDPDSLINPVAFSVSFLDIDNDTISVTWYLDEEEIGNWIHAQRYIYPDQNDLTVIIDDGKGGTDSMSINIHTVPPKGWGDEPDNTRNRVIFWIIFGSAGTILLVATIWVIFFPSKNETNNQVGSTKGRPLEAPGDRGAAGEET